jgi:two-component system, NarL family, invasion response regulator UvrY
MADIMAGIINILVVGDHPVFCEGFTQMINQEADFKICGIAANAVSSLKMIHSLKPDIIIVDTAVTGKDGKNSIEFIGNIKSHYPRVPIIVFTLYAEPSYADLIFKAGAKGYVTKQEATETITKAIRKVHGGGMYISETIADRIIYNRYNND